jgi:hypothetical protein
VAADIMQRLTRPGFSQGAFVRLVFRYPAQALCA